MSGKSIPPTKPTTLDFVVRPAITPTRNEPSCSLNVTDITFGVETTVSIMPNFLSVYCSDPVFIACSIKKPTAIERSTD